MRELPEPLAGHDRTTLVELVNRVVDRGVCLSGDVTISVADVDLLYLGLSLVLCAPDLVEERRVPAAPLPGRPARGSEEEA